MNCPSFAIWEVPVSEGKITVCSEVRKNYDKALYSPSKFQMEEYCQGKSYKRCPFYLNAYRENILEPPLLVEGVSRY